MIYVNVHSVCVEQSRHHGADDPCECDWRDAVRYVNDGTQSEWPVTHTQYNDA